MDAEEGKLDGENAEALKALQDFIVGNDDLLALESHISRFNIFDVLGITHFEIRHSNFLAFILDPAKSHRQGQVFLKAVLMDLFRKAPPAFPLSPIDLDGTDLRGVEVRREWKNIDLLITCKEPRFAVVIENKIRADEHSDQLSRYQRTIKEHYPDLRALYVYLTPDGIKPSEASWLSYTYADIRRVLTRVQKTRQNAIGADVLVFLDHYLDLLGTRIMSDDKLDELCRRIYEKHRRALDLIWAHVGSPASGMMAEVAAAVEKDPRWHFFRRMPNWLEFVPTEWLDWLPPFAYQGDDRKSWIYVYFLWARDRLLWGVDMAPMEDSAKRIEIATKLLDQCVACGFRRPQSKEVKNNRSRIAAVETALQWGEENEPEPEAIRVAVKKTLNELYPKLEKLALVLKPLCNLPASTQ